MIVHHGRYTLSELNSLVREAIEASFPDLLWVVAEISEARLNARGHCYLGLVEKDEQDVVAEMRATIWASAYRKLAEKFMRATGEEMRKGMQILMQAEVTFHERYGLSLNIREIDPSYTLGEMARKKHETIERLRKEGMIGLNSKLAMPVVVQRIAVISSETAAGFGDFANHLARNPRGFRVSYRLFQSLMQGPDAEDSIIASLKSIRKNAHAFDCVVMIRGGGSQTDLSCFDGYRLACAIAKLPLPVITGIGHERDDTVADIVAHTKRKTPTDAAEFILALMSGFEDALFELSARLAMLAKSFTRDQGHRLKFLAQGISHAARGMLGHEQGRLAGVAYSLGKGSQAALHEAAGRLNLKMAALASAARSCSSQQEARVAILKQAVRLLDPENVLQRGYSITYFGGRSLKRADSVRAGDVLFTRLHEGTITSTVEDTDG